MATHDFEFTQNSAKHAVDGLLASAETAAIVDEAVAAGKSMDEAGAAVFHRMRQEEIQEFGKLIRIVNLLSQMGTAFGQGSIDDQVRFESPSGRLKNNALLGYKAILQHFVDSAPAETWMQFFDTAETVGDVYAFFLQENQLTLEADAYALPGYDAAFVEGVLTVQLGQRKGVRFAINQTAMDEPIAK